MDCSPGFLAMTTPNEPTQPRRAERHAAELIFAAITEPGTATEGTRDQAFGVVLDVSEGGMRLATPQPPKAKRRVQVRVAIEEQIFAIEANVRWVKQVRVRTYEVGLRFDAEDFGKAEFLADFMARVATEQLSAVD